MLVASLRSSEHIHHSSPFETGPYKHDDAILRRQKCAGYRSTLLRFLYFVVREIDHLNHICLIYACYCVFMAYHANWQGFRERILAI